MSLTILHRHSNKCPLQLSSCLRRLLNMPWKIHDTSCTCHVSHSKMACSSWNSDKNPTHHCIHQTTWLNETIFLYTTIIIIHICIAHVSRNVLKELYNKKRSPKTQSNQAINGAQTLSFQTLSLVFCFCFPRTVVQCVPWNNCQTSEADASVYIVFVYTLLIYVVYL